MDTLQESLLANLNEFTAFARKRLADPELAADAVQESMLKALKCGEQLENAESARAWFYSILRRTIIDLYRRRDARERGLARLEQELAAPPTAEEERTACACIGKLLPTLKPEYAELINRLDLGDEGHAAVAQSLRITPGNLKVRLHRARGQLRERLETTCGLCATHGCLNCTCADSGKSCKP